MSNFLITGAPFIVLFAAIAIAFLAALNDKDVTEDKKE